MTRQERQIFSSSVVKETGFCSGNSPEDFLSAGLESLAGQLMSAIDNHNPVSQENAQEFILLLVDLNRTLTSQERMALGIE